MKISIRNLGFTYDGSPEPVFTDASAELDSSWRLGLVGRNGRGKTTLLSLMAGKYPYQGTIVLPLTPVYYPYPVADPTLPALSIMEAAGGGAPVWRLLKEAELLALSREAISRPFHTLSKGEQTKALLCALFARQDAYPLIDEPTNHLDIHGRELVAAYLSRKDGFLLVSHDRAFLNACVDHVLALNKTGFQVVRGSYDVWQEQFDRQNDFERKRNDSLRKDAARLADSARKAVQWSQRGEKGKFHVLESQTAAPDRGYIGARSAAMMKRAQNTVKRRERALAETESLLQNIEYTGELRLRTLEHPKAELLSVKDGFVVYGDRTICGPLHFSIRQGDRVALSGGNGSGKSSVLRTLCGQSNALRGTIRLASGLVISRVPQETDGLTGSLRDLIRREELDETLFKAILRNMDFSREQFDRDLSAYSQGQKKKVLLAAGLCRPAHLYLWDEPLNYIDVFSRRQVEELILDFQPTLLLVEHDRRFLDRVCNREEIKLQK